MLPECFKPKTSRPKKKKKTFFSVQYSKIQLELSIRLFFFFLLIRDHRSLDRDRDLNSSMLKNGLISTYELILSFNDNQFKRSTRHRARIFAYASVCIHETLDACLLLTPEVTLFLIHLF